MPNAEQSGVISDHYAQICANYIKEITDHNDKESLKRLKFRVIETDKEIQEAMTGMPRFSQRKLHDLVTQIFKNIEAKESQVDTDRFFFQGPPIPPSTLLATRTHTPTTTPYQSTPVIDGLSKEKKTIRVPHHHLLMQNVHSSIIVSSSIVHSVHAENISNSIVHIQSDGPVYLKNVAGNIIVVSCQQLRLHAVVDSTVFVNVTSNRVIIEDCSNIAFVKLFSEAEDFSVDDFNCPVKTEENANYKYMSSHDSRVPDYNWVFSAADGPLEDETCRRIRGFTL